MYKIGDKVKLTPIRFRDFAGSQGVVDPNRIYRIYKIIPEDNGVYLDGIINQQHDYSHVVKIKKPTVIL